PHVEVVYRINHGGAEIAPAVLGEKEVSWREGFVVGSLAVFENEVAAEGIGRILTGSKGVVAAGELNRRESGEPEECIFVAIHGNAWEGVKDLPLCVLDPPELDGGAVGGQLPPLHRAVGRQSRREENGVRAPDRAVAVDRVNDARVIVLDEK